jgi:hypothetical protein
MPLPPLPYLRPEYLSAPSASEIPLLTGMADTVFPGASSRGSAGVFVGWNTGRAGAGAAAT